MPKGYLTDAQAMALGQCPHTVYADTDAHTGLKHFALKIVEAAVFTVLTDSLLTGSVATLTFAAGDWYYGNITALTLASGAVIGFDRPTPQASAS